MRAVCVCVPELLIASWVSHINYILFRFTFDNSGDYLQHEETWRHSALCAVCGKYEMYIRYV